MDIEEDICEIAADGGRMLQLKLQVPPKFYGRIIGAKGNKLRQLQQETNTNIRVPRKGEADTIITIKGTTREDIVAAKNRIDKIVNTSTHILTISFANEDIKSSFLKFKEDVLEDNETSDDLTLLFQIPEKLHLTIIHITLFDDQDTAIALECLEDCRTMIVDKFLQDGPLQVEMAGLSCENANPKVYRKLHANVISERMKEVADEVAKHFAERCLVKLRKDERKLHVKLMHTKFSIRNERAKQEAETSRDMNKKRKWKFDATGILEKFGDFHFGSFTVNEIHLSKLYTPHEPYELLPNGYYESTGVIKF